MAYQISVQGNFFIVFDDVARKDVIHSPRSQTRFFYDETAPEYKFFSTEVGTPNFADGINKFNFSDLKDSNGYAWADEATLNEFLNTNLGGVNQPIFAYKSNFCDYSKTASLTLPTTLTKLDYSGATLVDESEDLFDAANSRILGFNQNEVGIASISMTVDTSGGGSNNYVEIQLRGYDNTDTLLFSKRSSTIQLSKSVAADAINKNLEFYFGTDVAYFEVWYRGSSALTFNNPAITVIKF